jgi:hypothetical protein
MATTRPKSATFLFKPGSTQLIAADAVVQVLLGFKANLTHTQGAATFQTTPAQVIFPFQPDKSDYTISSATLGSCRLSGTAPCSGAGWDFFAQVPISNGVLTPVQESGSLVMSLGKGFQFAPTTIPNTGTTSIISLCSVLSVNAAFETNGTIPFPTSASISASYPAAISTSPQTAWNGVTGSASITMPIVYGFPTLPDPYTSNSIPLSEERIGSESVTISVDWSRRHPRNRGMEQAE